MLAAKNAVTMQPYAIKGKNKFLLLSVVWKREIAEKNIQRLTFSKDVHFLFKNNMKLILVLYYVIHTNYK
jgi:hypothetical protein